MLERSQAQSYRRDVGSLRATEIVFLIALASCTLSDVQAKARNTASFGGEVDCGLLFARGFGDRFTFLLRPVNHGWHLVITDERGTLPISSLTPPLHATNACDVVGWHFRNSDDTGPNEPGPKNVNAPGRERKFIFSPEVWRTIPAGSHPTPGEIDRIREYGQGSFVIEDYRLSEISPGDRARFEWIRFRVELSWPGE